MTPLLTSKQTSKKPTQIRVNNIMRLLLYKPGDVAEHVNFTSMKFKGSLKLQFMKFTFNQLLNYLY